MRNVARMTERRLLDAERLGLSEVPFHASEELPIAVPIQWIRAARWDQRVSMLVRGLALIVGPKPRRPRESPLEVLVPAVFALLKPYFTPAAVLNGAFEAARRSEDEAWIAITPPPAPRIARLLTANRVNDAVELAHRELRARGLPVPRTPPADTSVDGRRLLGALILPLAGSHLRVVLSRYFRSGPSRPTHLTSTRDQN